MPIAPMPPPADPMEELLRRQRGPEPQMRQLAPPSPDARMRQNLPMPAPDPFATPGSPKSAPYSAPPMQDPQMLEMLQRMNYSPRDDLADMLMGGF